MKSFHILSFKAGIVQVWIEDRFVSELSGHKFSLWLFLKLWWALR